MIGQYQPNAGHEAGDEGRQRPTAAVAVAQDHKENGRRGAEHQDPQEQQEGLCLEQHRQQIASPVVQIGQKQRAEDHRVCNQTRCARQEDARSEQTAEFEIPVVEQGRKNHSQNQHDRHLNDQIKYRVKQALPESLVL